MKLLLCVTVLLSVMNAQPLTVKSTVPPGFIDGAVTPEQIPDFVALRLFLASTASPATPMTTSVTLQPTSRQKAKLGRANLNDADIAIVLRAVQVWQTKAASPPVDLDGTAQILLTTLEVNLSPQGFASLVALLRTEKKHMKIAPVPDMSGHKH